MEPDTKTEIEKPLQPTPPAAVEKTIIRKSSGTSLLVLLIVLLMAAGAGAYWWRDKQAKNHANSQQVEIANLQKRVAELEKKPVTETTAKPGQETATAPSAATIANIKSSISSNNTSALEGYMASTVKVIIAASEGIGDRTPAQAIGDLKYLDSASDPWNFELPATTLAKYRASDYKQFFPETAVVGKSADNYVVSFTFNNVGKINGVFMAVNSDLLQ